MNVFLFIMTYDLSINARSFVKFFIFIFKMPTIYIFRICFCFDQCTNTCDFVLI